MASRRISAAGLEFPFEQAGLGAGLARHSNQRQSSFNLIDLARSVFGHQTRKFPTDPVEDLHAAVVTNQNGEVATSPDRSRNRNVEDLLCTL